MSPSEDFQSYKQFHRKTFVRSPADIIDRWKSRVIANGLHIQKRLGAEVFLARFGRAITEKKAIQWAIKAEIEKCPEMADVFWEKAYNLKLNPPIHKAKRKAQQIPPSQNAVKEEDAVVVGTVERVYTLETLPKKNDIASLRVWWHNILKTHGKYACCAFILALPADTHVIEYLTKLSNELHLLSKENCLVLAMSDTKTIAYGGGNKDWEAAIHEQVGNGHSLEIAKLFNISFTEFPCMVLFRDIRSAEHRIVSLKDMDMSEISHIMRSVFFVILSANGRNIDPLAELELYKKKQEFQKAKRTVISEGRKYLDMTFEAAMQAHFQSLIKPV
jgi:hypothetical protein